MKKVRSHWPKNVGREENPERDFRPCLLQGLGEMAERLSNPPNSVWGKGHIKCDVYGLPRSRAMVEGSHLQLMSRRGKRGVNWR